MIMKKLLSPLLVVVLVLAIAGPAVAKAPPMATGSAQFGPNPADYLQFNAQGDLAQSKGSVYLSMMLYSGLHWVQANVTAYIQVDNQAGFYAKVTDYGPKPWLTGPGSFVPTDVEVFVEDNGQGKGAVDRVFWGVMPQPSALTLPQGLDLVISLDVWVPITSGNIRVH